MDATWLTENEAAKRLVVSPRTLQSWRSKGGGPPYTRIYGRVVRYTLTDLISWMEAQKETNTSGGM